MSLIIVPKNNKQKIPRDKVEEFVKLNWKPSKIAKELGCSSAGVREILRQNNIRYNIVDFEKEFNEAIKANGATLKNKYINVETPVTVICKNGHEFSKVPKYIKYRKYICNQCFELSRKGKTQFSKINRTWQDVFNICEGFGLKLLNCPTNNYQEKVFNTKQAFVWKFRCKCSNEFSPRLIDVLNKRSRSCGCVRSQPQQDILQFIKGQGFECTNDSRRILKGGYQLDIYVPELKLAIEYNGLIFHGQKIKKEKARLDSLRKCLECKALGIKLITIFEDEWVYNKERTLGFISSIIKKKNSIGARKCTIAKVPSDHTFSFLESHHLLGGIKTTGIGLYHKEELVCLASFKWDNKQNGWNLTRYCNKIDISVTGGLSKIIKYFKQNHDESIFTYSDNRISSGALYRAIGFTEVARPPSPSYWYFRTGTQGPRFHKSNFRKDKIKTKFPEVYDPSKTEWEMMQEAGYDRIWDCGTTKWLLK